MDNPMFCLDCSRIGNSSRQCDCGSRALYPIRAWLDRKPALEVERETGIQRYRREKSERRPEEIADLERMYK